jgi:hypothetical protein
MKTLDECKLDTLKHIKGVQKRLLKIANLLIERSMNHDQSKLEEPELSGFANAPDLNSMTYNSPEYNENLKKIQDTLNHHYANNRHHPQHFKNGINDMNILDIFEMLCDWADSSKRNKNGNLKFSIEQNANKFNISPQLAKILENSIDLVE